MQEFSRHLVEYFPLEFVDFDVCWNSLQQDQRWYLHYNTHATITTAAFNISPHSHTHCIQTHVPFTPGKQQVERDKANDFSCSQRCLIIVGDKCDQQVHVYRPVDCRMLHVASAVMSMWTRSILYVTGLALTLHYHFPSPLINIIRL